VEHSHFFEQDHGYTTTLALADFGAQFYKQRFNIAPLDVSACRAGENQFKSSLVLPHHAGMVPLSGTELNQRTARRLTQCRPQNPVDTSGPSQYILLMNRLITPSDKAIGPHA
jgi:hypothetical protein